MDHTHHNNDNVIEDNTLFNNHVQLSITDYSNWKTGTGQQNSTQGSGGANYMASYTNTYQGNVLYALSGQQRCMTVLNVWSNAYTGAQGLVDFGTFSDNYYFHPFSETPIHVGQKYTLGNNNGFWMPRSLARWQQLTGKDLNSQVSPLSLPELDVLSLGTPETSSFSTSTTDWESCLSLVDEVQEMPGNELKSVVSGPNCRWVRRTSALTANGTTYRLSLWLKAATPTDVYLGLQGNDNEVFGGAGIVAGSEPRYITRHFTLPSGVQPKPMLLKADQAGQVHGLVSGQNYGTGPALWVDEVKLEPCSVNSGYAAQIATQHILRYNNPLEAIGGQNAGPSFTLTGSVGECWSDVYGNLYAAGEPVPLPDEWTSIVLYRLESTQLLEMVNDEHHVYSEETITEDKNVKGRIIVHPGAYLTIDGATLGFAPSTPEITTNITVLPGGTLHLMNGAQLSNLLGCYVPPQMWDGVRVLSYYDASGPQWQSWPGQVIMESGAKISDALVGVLCGEGDPADPGFANSTQDTYGGVIEATDAIFENNRIDVVAKQWVSNLGTVSSPFMAEPCQARVRFINTQFLTTAPLHGTNPDPVTHIRAADVELLVHGCTFANDLPSHTTSAAMGHGIEASNAYLKVEPCENGNCPIGSNAPNTFRNLDHAIHAAATDGQSYSSIRNNTFTDNICAVYSNGEIGLVITNNEITMGRWYGITMSNPEEEWWLDHHRGLFTTRSYGQTIQDNILSKSTNAPGNAQMEGIVVGYTEDHNDIVYRNTASNLSLGFVGEGISAQVDGEPDIVGLQFQCNTNIENTTNLMSRKALGDQDFEFLHTIRGIQGNPSLAAGNTFDQDTDWDFDKYTTQVPIIRYYYDPGVPAQLPLNHPVDVTPLPITGTGNACGDGPGVIVGGHTISSLKPVLQQSKYDYGSIRYLYEQLIDGGNTDEVVQEIISTWPQDVWDLRTYLLDLSPYLSVAALQQLVNMEFVPVAIKLEICVANPEATQKDGFLRWAEYDAHYPLPAYALATIAASWNQQTYRFALVAQMAGKHATMTQAANHLLFFYRNDSTLAHPDSLRWVWQQVRTNAARYAETGLLMRQERYSDAVSVLNAMPQEKYLRPREQAERQHMLDYISVLAIAKADGRGPARLNTQEVQQLEQLVGDQYDRPAVWASNLLCAHYRKCRAPYTGGAPTPKRLGQAQNAALVATPGLGLSLHPNPASNWVAISYHLPGYPGTVQLRMRDAQARVVHTKQASGDTGQVVWDVRTVAPGVYTVELLREGKVERIERLVVQP